MAMALRDAQRALKAIPNVGPAMARDLIQLGYHSPDDIRGADPKEMYDRLCALTGERQDPCVLDTFMAVVDYANGNPGRPWWEFTEERKRRYGQCR